MFVHVTWDLPVLRFPNKTIHNTASAPLLPTGLGILLTQQDLDEVFPESKNVTISLLLHLLQSSVIYNYTSGVYNYGMVIVVIVKNVTKFER
jgi:hypothetical protein